MALYLIPLTSHSPAEHPCPRMCAGASAARERECARVFRALAALILVSEQDRAQV